MIRYRRPRLIHGSKGWYIEYYYQIPMDIQPLHDNKKWKRFRVIEDMNRRKGPDREVYAEWLLAEVNQILRNGFSPFKRSQEYIEQQASRLELPTVMDVERAFHTFLEAWRKRGLNAESVRKYERYITKLQEWLRKNKMLHSDIREIKIIHIETFLNDSRKNNSNREYNNTFDFIRTCFKYLLKKGFIEKSPCDGIDKLKTKSTKHRFYDKKNLDDITKALLASDPYTYFAAQTVYYLCIRSDKELMNFKVGSIHWEQNKILLESEGTKGSSAGYVPMDENIKQLFLEHGIDKYPGNYYVFGVDGMPSPKKFSKGFFARRFRKVRDAADLDKNYTLYAMKHTRIIHLKQDGLSDADIMSLTRHKDFVSYAKYLRDLGLDADPAKISKVSRKV